MPRHWIDTPFFFLSFVPSTSIKEKWKCRNNLSFHVPICILLPFSVCTHTHIPTSQLNNHLHWLKYLRAVGGWYISSRFVFVFVLLAWFAPSPHKKLWRASCWKNKRKKKCFLDTFFIPTSKNKNKREAIWWKKKILIYFGIVGFAVFNYYSSLKISRCFHTYYSFFDDDEIWNEKTRTQLCVSCALCAAAAARCVLWTLCIWKKKKQLKDKQSQLIIIFFFKLLVNAYTSFPNLIMAMCVHWRRRKKKSIFLDYDESVGWGEGE